MTGGLTDKESPPILVGGNLFGKIGMPEEKNPDMIFASLTHRIIPGLWEDCFRMVRKSESVVSNGVTAKEYAENPDGNLRNPYQWLRRVRYVATPAKRIWLEKKNGKMRTIGIR